MKSRLGFVGFGEAAYYYCRGILQAGVAQDDLIAFYYRLGQGTESEKRADEIGVRLTDDPTVFARNCDIVLSVAVPHGAEEAARRIVPHLSSQIYADLNSASPAVKRSVAALAAMHGIRFADVAILGSVARWRQQVPMVASGPGAAALGATLALFGTPVRFLGDEVGAAARFKMIRSAYTKGAALLMLETLMAADRAGLLDTMVEELSTTESASPLPHRLQGEINGTIRHADRQARELVYVIDTYQELGLTSEILPGVARLLANIAISTGTDFTGPWHESVHKLQKLLAVLSERPAE